MKRGLLAFLILAMGTTVFCAFHSANSGLRGELAAKKVAWQTQTRQLAQLLFEKQQVLERVSETRQQLAAQPPIPAHQQIDGKILTGDSLGNLSAAEREQLLAELEFNWNTTGDYLIVSKKSLAGISLAAIKGTTLTDAARAVLAITPEERAAVETMTQRLMADYTVWAEAHVQRAEPSGDVVAKYTLAADEAFSQSQSNRFVSEVIAALGPERGELLRRYSYQWMSELGMNNTTLSKRETTMIVKRYNAGDESRLGFELQHAGGGMSTDVSPWQPFPEAFRSIFPNGWTDLAKREGFELPKSFQKK